METNIEDSSTSQIGPLNYFNYFTEIEEEFVRRRGKPMLISPMDWALIETWKDAGIPLHIVLRAINESFDAYDARAQKHRRVNSMFYCQQAVEAAFAQHRLAQVGGSNQGQSAAEDGTSDQGAGDESAFPKQVILEFLARCEEELRMIGSRTTCEQREINDTIARARARLKELTEEINVSRQVNAEGLELDLDGIDRMILETLTRECGDEKLQQIRDEAKSQLRSYRKKMDKAVYEQTVQNFVSRRLREINNIPRLSLFYL